jgi:hypothetical protein
MNPSAITGSLLLTTRRLPGTVREVVATHAVLGLEMTDPLLEATASFYLAFDLRGHPTLPSCGVDLKLAIGQRVVSGALWLRL